MGQFDPRFTPLLAALNGFQQEPLAGAAVLLTDLFNVPPQANSGWVQVPSGQTLEFRTDGNTGGSTYMQLPGPCVLPLTNRNQLRNLVIHSPAGITVVSAAFFEGAVGPMPPAPEIDAVTGGVIPPPPPGFGAVLTENTLHVMKNGNDATGTRNRLDLPFLTIDAAQSAATAWDTIVIWPGEYNEPLTLGDVTFVLMGAVIYTVDTAIDCDGVLMRVTGFGVIRSDGNNPAVYVQNSGELYLEATIQSDGDAVYVENGSSAVIRGNITAVGAGLFADMSVVTVYGSVSSASGIGVQSVRGVTNIYGNIDAALVGVQSTDNTRVYGDVICFQGVGCNCDDGTQVIYGNVLAEKSYGVNCAGGSQEIHGSVTTMFDYGARCQGGVQTIYGTVRATTDAAGNAVLCLGGNQYIRGNVLHEGTGPALNVTGGRCEVIGNVSQTGNGFGAAAVGGSYEIWGNVSSATNIAARANGGEGTVHGDCTSPAAVACEAAGGSLFTLDGVATSFAENTPGANVTGGGAMILMGGAVVKGDGTADSISGTGVVKSYGAYANAAAAGTITIQGTLNILP